MAFLIPAKNPKTLDFQTESLHMDISVSGIPFQLRIGIAVSGFYAVHFTSTGINHLWHELMILNAICLILWANKNASGVFDPANKHWKFSFNCWLVGDSLDQIQLFYAHISLVMMPGRPAFVFTLPERRWYCITVLISCTILTLRVAVLIKSSSEPDTSLYYSIEVDIKYTGLLLIAFLKLLCLKLFFFKLIIFSVGKGLVGPHYRSPKEIWSRHNVNPCDPLARNCFVC